MAQPETGSIELLVVNPDAAPVPVRPRQRIPHPELQTLSSQAGLTLAHAGAPFQAATDLAGAWQHLGAAAMGWTIVGGLASGTVDSKLETLFSQPWEILEVAAMSLGFGETMSAIDLCADAVLLVCGLKPNKTGRFYDLGELKRQQGKLAAPPALRAWIDQLLAHPDLALLEECRHHLTHRTPRRHITYRLDDRGLPRQRELAEITTLHGGQPAQWRGSIADLIPRLVGFGEEQLEALCRAILNARPTP